MDCRGTTEDGERRNEKLEIEEEEFGEGDQALDGGRTRMKSEATPQEWERGGDGGVRWEGKREEGRGG